MKPNLIPILRNRHVEHLLICCEEASDFSVIGEFEQDIINLLKNHIGDREQNEDFRSYIQRKIRQVKVRGLDNQFTPFNVENDGQ